MTAALALAILLPSLLGCAAYQQRRAALQQIANQPITCAGDTDCEVRWSRALQWVSANSHWKLRHVNDMIITTEGPLDTVFPAYEVQKIPSGDGSYAITIRAACGNPFGCSPDTLEAVAAFSVFVRQ